MLESLLRLHRTKKMFDNINRDNSMNRGVTYYKPSQIEAFFNPNDMVDNITISGGHSQLRTRSLIATMLCAYNQQMPIVVIHESNRYLEQMAYNYFSGTGMITIINHGNPVFDPFINMSDAEISKLVIDSAPKKNEIKTIGKYYIEGMAAFARMKVKEPYCNMFLNCPHNELFDRIDLAFTSRIIDDSSVQRVKALLMSGQSERASVESYFENLKNQISDIVAPKKDTVGKESIYTAIKRNRIILVDILSNMNNFIIDLLINQLINTSSAAKSVLVILDSMATDNSEILTNFIKKKSNKFKVVISTDDLYSMMGGDDKGFATVVGNSSKIILHSHTSGASCSKWADTIGFYDKQEATRSYGNNRNHQGPFSIFSGSSNSTTINVGVKREHIIKPEEINRMSSNEAYIYDCVRKELAHTDVV